MITKQAKLNRVANELVNMAGCIYFKKEKLLYKLILKLNLLKILVKSCWALWDM